MAYNHGKAEYKWKLWKEREEKILRDSGVTEDTIEAIRFYDRQAFNSDRRYYERVQETDTYFGYRCSIHRSGRTENSTGFLRLY